MLQVTNKVVAKLHICSSFNNVQGDIYVSDLMGMFDKRRFKKLLLFALNFDVRNPRTYQDMDPKRTTTRDLFSRFDLGLDVMEFTGHAIALHSSDRSVTGT